MNNDPEDLRKEHSSEHRSREKRSRSRDNRNKRRERSRSEVSAKNEEGITFRNNIIDIGVVIHIANLSKRINK